MKIGELPEFVRELLVATLAAAIVGILYLVIEKSTGRSLIAIISAVGIAIMIMMVILFMTQRTISSSYRAKLRLVGIQSIVHNYQACASYLELIQQATIAVDFLGISARTIFEVAGIEDIIKTKIRDGVVFHFLLMNPASAD